jgi:LPPG:FO 2-phospho-L-lactate transferase
MIAVLTGGTGGAKLVDGLGQILAPEELTIIVNTGDDHTWWGLYVSPDVDSITYVLAGMLSPERGWGVRRDTFHCLQAMKRLGEPTWFSVGDRDLATHLVRTKLLSEGRSLSEVTATIRARLGVLSPILPMSDQPIETRIETPAGELSFEEYFVQRFYRDPVRSVHFRGAAQAKPGPGIVEAIERARAIVLAPSNPVTSIGPILAVPGIREALVRTRAKIVAVSPIIGRAAVSGPAANLMAAQGWEVSIAGIVEAYRDFLDGLVIDESDRERAQALSGAGCTLHATNIWMRSPEDRARIARAALALACPEMAAPPIGDEVVA